MSAVKVGHRRPYLQGQHTGLALVLGLAFALPVGAALYIAGWPVAAMLGTFVLAVWLALSPRQGLYAMLAAVIIVEGSSPLAFVRAAEPMYQGIDGLVPIGLPLSPLELGMGFLVLGTVRQAAVSQQPLRFGESFWPLAFATAIVVVGFVRGINSGGDVLIGFHEMRPLLYLLPVYFLTTNLLRERRHFRQLAVVLVLAISAMAVGALWTHLTLVRPGELRGVADVSFGHENAVFAGLVVILMASMMIWGKGFGPRFVLVVPGLLALAAILVMKRRTGLIALDAGLIVLSMVLLRNNWRTFLVVMPILMVAAVLYLGAYWNAAGGLGQGARAVRSVIGQEVAAEDLSSKEYREREAFNVETNIRWQPFWGLGFGKPYSMPAPLPDLTDFWSFQRYIPHNTLLWTWMKGGVLAFVLILAVFGQALMRGMALARKRLEPLLRAWATVTTASVVMMFLFAWQDLGLASLRAVFVLGFCLGLITVIGWLPERADSRASGGASSQAKDTAASYGERVG